MKISIEKRQLLIEEIKGEIQNKLGKNIGIKIDKSSTRNGTRLYVNIPKQEVKNLEVIVYCRGEVQLGVAVSGKDNRKFSSIIKNIMVNGGYNIVKDQTNPRYNYTLEAFVETYQFLTEHKDLEDIESSRISKKLFKYEYNPLKIAERYKFAIDNEDQPMLDLCRSLLDADRFDSDISLNHRTEENSYREHVVPCVMIHNRIIELIKEKDVDLNKVAELIENNLKIAYIKPNEAEYLDCKLNLRTNMPKDWTWESGNIEARLTKANIKIENLR